MPSRASSCYETMPLSGVIRLGWLGASLGRRLVAAPLLPGRPGTWHFLAFALLSCGRRGTFGTWGGLGRRDQASDAAPLLAGRGAILVTPAFVCQLGRRSSFAWQAWYLATSARLALRDICLTFRVAGVALTALGLALVVALGGTYAAPPLAGVALGDICLTFAWQASHFVTSSFLSCGRRGTYGWAGVRAWSP
eukprot:s1199_g8.t1